MYRVVKRLVDIVVSLLAMAVLLPLLLLIAVAVVLESAGSPIFTQMRVGRNNQPFAIFKFRSMVKNAASIGAWCTTANDARITRVGKFLRFTSLDEIPQLWNVVIGDMSLVGPRPELPRQETEYRPEDWALRHRVRPGITGLAQVNGRSKTTIEERLQYDLDYAANPTLTMDLGILLKTVSVVLRRAGVN